MAAMGSFRILKSCMSLHRPLIISAANGTGSSWTGIQSRRTKSFFPDYFIHPVFREEEQQKLKESGEVEKYAFTPIRPAKTTDTGSVFYDALVDKVINHIFREGNKKLGRELLDKTFETIKRIQLDKYHDTEDPAERSQIVINPWEILHKAVENGKPFLETTPVKRGGHTYQVPVPIRPNKQQALSIKWLIEAGKDKEDEMRFYKKFAYVLIDSANNSGPVIKRKQELHKRCEANRAYAHYRWG